LYQQLVERLAVSISTAETPQEKRIPSERDLAKLSGYSVITVKRALHELELRGILTRQHGSGSFPLRKPSVQDLLAIASPQRLAVFNESLFHASTALRYDLLYFLQKMLAQSPTILSLVDEEAISQHDTFDGIFVIGRQAPKRLATRRTKVFVGGPAGNSSADSIQIDLDDAATKATKFIQSLNGTTIYFFGSNSSERPGGEALLQRLTTRLPKDYKIISFFGSKEEVYVAAQQWLRHNHIPVLFFSAFYLCTGALIRAAESIGRPLGKEIPLLAFGGNNTVFEDVVDLHVLTIDREAMARAALEEILLRIMAPGAPFRVRFIHGASMT